MTNKIKAAVYHSNGYDTLLIARNDYTEEIRITADVWKDLPTFDEWMDCAQEQGIDKIEDLTNADYGELIAYYDEKWHITDQERWDERKEFYDEVRYNLNEWEW